MNPLAVLPRGELDRSLKDLPGSLSAAGYDVWIVPHLYHLPEDSGVWGELRDRPGPIAFLLPLHPRPIEALARRHGAWKAGCRAVDLRIWKTPESLIAALGRPGPDPGRPGAVRTIEAPASRRWYPLMDEGRCGDCGHCLQFCLFGVYERDGSGKIRIVHPDRCKPGCPACSRICPRGALMFPLYEADEAIAGAPGKYPEPDAAARRMYYSRTGRPCPRCGRAGGSARIRPGASLCPECGRPFPSGRKPDALDALLDGLERLQEGPR